MSFIFISLGCKTNEFACLDGTQCIDAIRKCDRRSDCNDGSDESGCPLICQGNDFMCYNGLECIPQRFRCDGSYQCSDQSDEIGCSSPDPYLRIITYPTEQTIEAGREVVFQCRDEGPLRARVSWSRSGGLSLPTRSTDYDGRLEMPNIQLSHMGTYICQAIDYQGVEGSTASVYLRVTQSKFMSFICLCHEKIEL